MWQFVVKKFWETVDAVPGARAFFDMWRIADLRNRVLFTLGMLIIYRLGYYIPLVGVDTSTVAEWAKSSNKSGAAANLIAYMSTFTGGALHQSTIFGLGIAPYISASIIFQLLATAWPTLQQLQKEGPAGRQKIMEWTRYATVPLCVVQGAFWLQYVQANHFVYPDMQNTPLFWICGLLGLTAGSIFLMWLGEQIDKYGIGNGISLIIAAGILAQKPTAIRQIIDGFSIGGSDTKPFHLDTVIFLFIAFVCVVAGSIAITQGQRRIPIQQAKHTRGRRVFGGQRSFLPLRVNHGGVMPVIFASSLMIFPSMIFGWARGQSGDHWLWGFLDNHFQYDGFLYLLCYIGLIYFFSYFWTTVQFQPKEMATQLRDHGSFIPGLRPGPRTAEYLETVMERITYVGAGFLALIAVIPMIVSGYFKIPPFVASFLGGTGLLIVVSVILDLIQRIEAGLMMRNYQGFLGGGGSGKGPRIRGARS